jgi:hypothetical protein
MAETIEAGGLAFFFENRMTGSDGGPSLQVRADVEGCTVQLLRFDMFYKQPHYHYAPDGLNIRYDIDPLTLDDGIGWAIGLLRAKLPQLLAKAEYPVALSQEATAAALTALPGIEAGWRTEKPPAPTNAAGQAATAAHE